jgi:hypothetical protein
MNGSGGLLTKYSFGVCRGQADAGVRPNWIFNSRNNQIKRVKIEYSIVRMIGIRGSEIFNSWNDQIRIRSESNIQ